RLHDAAVVGLPFPRDEAALLHAVEKPGNVWVVRNHAVADAAAGKALRLSATQNAKNVVLSARESGRFQQLFGLLSESVGGLQESDEKPVLKGDEEDAN